MPNGALAPTIETGPQTLPLSETGNHDGVTSKRSLRARLLTYLVLLDLVTLCTGMMAASWSYLGSIGHERLLTLLPLLLPVYYLTAIRQQAYRLAIVIHPSPSMRRACLSLLTAMLIVISITFVLKSSDSLSRGLALGGTLGSCVLLIIGRYYFARLAYAVLDGSPESEVVLIEDFDPPIGCTSYKIDLKTLNIVPNINDPAMLDRIGRLLHDTDRVILACRPGRRGVWAAALKGVGVNVEVLTPELDAIGAISTTRYHDIATTLIATGPLNAVDRVIKRLFDLTVALSTLILLSPLFLGLAILIKLDSPGPVLFVQDRIGKGNRMFRMFKFRSMRNDLLDHTASKLTTRNDARVTQVGRFIRKTSLDELPQMLNVLRGDMSIVGPRPHATGALAGKVLYWEVTSHYWSRHAVKPGLTGLAQVQGFRGNTETSDDLLNRVQADLAYLENWSIWRDIMLVLQTFRVLTHRNAF
ncbi:lipopolysaccharide/colanic/teichoic acid biosynthesis glycosyltransferase [Sphingomonas sp. SORGH_AS802]|nr:lipopolysaccharide/colanic/teichoic acid biosynthesis glycosyltransferase [Sphingomonas sp. SORGH_AS_0438]MDR6135588.1 lipopolysaccharide/colanic/teichoic acid biosynthesis glycosyltransferase [Sphingomonas sp. SORGH_AS_0802]